MAALKRKSSAKDVVASREPRKTRRTSLNFDASNHPETRAPSKTPRRSKKAKTVKPATIDELHTGLKASGPLRKNSNSRKPSTVRANVESLSSVYKTNTNLEEPTTKSQEGQHFWLMKAEPESRIEKGVDVKFSIDDLKDRTEPEAWDGQFSNVH